MKLKTPKLFKVIVGTYFILSAFTIVLFIGLFIVGGYWRNFFQGPKEVISKPSPDGMYNAFVSNAPSIDGPNQGMYIESSDKQMFYKVSPLEEDIDFIKDIIWSEDSSQVVFWSKDFITQVNLKDLSIKKEYLGDWWHREGEGKQTKFKQEESKEVEWVRFEDRELEYNLRDLE